jgi:predicted small secreted protein
MKTFAACLVSLVVLIITGCNTVKGVGQDLQKAGTAIEGAAKKN